MTLNPVRPVRRSDADSASLPGVLPRVLVIAGVLGLGGGLAIPGCITSRYRADGAADGSTRDATDAAVGDAAATDLASSHGGTDLASAAPDAGRDASAPTTDPFDPGSCADPPVSSAQALALLGAANHVKLADATLYRRSRTCTGMTPATCGAWGTPVEHKQDLLTWSGGVTTDYKTFNFPTHLLVFSQAGQPKFVIRHTTDYLHDQTANARGVGFSLGSDPMENTYPVIYVWDVAPKPSHYQDLQGLLGDKGQLHTALHCARLVFTSGVSTEIAALYQY